LGEPASLGTIFRGRGKKVFGHRACCRRRVGFGGPRGGGCRFPELNSRGITGASSGGSGIVQKGKKARVWPRGAVFRGGQGAAGPNPFGTRWGGGPREKFGHGLGRTVCRFKAGALPGGKGGFPVRPGTGTRDPGTLFPQGRAGSSPSPVGVPGGGRCGTAGGGGGRQAGAPAGGDPAAWVNHKLRGRATGRVFVLGAAGRPANGAFRAAGHWRQEKKTGGRGPEGPTRGASGGGDTVRFPPNTAHPAGGRMHTAKGGARRCHR